LRRYLWIDAVCIDQENKEERMQQVSIMDKIYMAGDKVLIWLGDEIPGIQCSLSKLDRIGQRQSAAEAHLRNSLSELFQRARDVRRKVGESCRFSGPLNMIGVDSATELGMELERVKKDWARLQEPKDIDMTLFEVDNEPLWHGIASLFSRSYWNRLWIVQEVTLSQKGRIICGPYSSDWDYFYKAARQIYELNLLKDPPLTLRRILGISDRRGNLWYKEQIHYKSLLDDIMHNHDESLRDHTIRGHSYRHNDAFTISHIEDLRAADRIETTSLKFLLEQFSDSQATDPRDRVFALLSLVDTRGLDQLQADYRLTEGQVYHKTMIYLLSQEQGFNILEYFAPPSLSRIRGTPSWVPDFSCPRLWTEELIQPILEARYPFRGPTEVNGESLVISGMVYGEIKACTIYVSPAEAFLFQRADSIIAQDNTTLSDLMPPDMSDFIFGMGIRYVDEYSEGEEESERGKWKEWLMRKIPQEEMFWDVLKSPNGLIALEMNEMPHGSFSKRFADPTSFSGQDLVDMYGTESLSLENEAENWERISRRLQREVQYQKRRKLLGVNRELRDMAYSWAQQERSSSLYLHKHGRQLFMMSCGISHYHVLGLGPLGLHGIKAGDLVVRLDGGRQLCALRSQPDSSYTFRGVVILESLEEDVWLPKEERRFIIR
jgi:hypothetical protein